MKLRIRGNSLRLRIQQQELETLRTQGSLLEELQLGPGDAATFRYALERHEGASVQLSFQHGRLRVGLPSDWIAELANTDRTGWDTEVDTGEGNTVRVMVEKDFPCIVTRPGEDDSDAFPPGTPVCQG
jgi:hypothetical protein